MMRVATRIAVGAALVAAMPNARSLRAQAKPSEHAAVTQTVAGATITVDYSRPSLRGRSSVFGTIVPYGTPWTPGANWATTIESDHDLTVNGQRLPKGKYSIWMIPSDREWTVTFSRAWHRFHTFPPRDSTMALRLSVKPIVTSKTETLTWWLPVVSGDSATLQMQWETTGIPLQIAVTPSTSR